MAWFYLFVARLFECGWAVGLKYTHGFTKRMPSLMTLAVMGLSLLFLSISMITILVYTAYVIWTGIEAVGVAIPRENHS